MSTQDWTTQPGAQPLATLHAATGARGYLQHAARNERAIGWVLWIGLAAVLVFSSL